MLMAQVQIFIKKSIWQSDFLFPGAIWLVSRLFIWIAMLLIAPNLPKPVEGVLPNFDLGVFDAWDSVHYRSIATSGYEFVDDGGQHNIAFFPLFPLMVRGVMNLGLSFEVAGLLVNNITFLAALYCVYFWVAEHHGTKGARWTATVLAWCPLSLFGTVIYTEGLYLFLSAAALRTFDRQQYCWTAFWGAMATATRPTGMALIPALLLAAWKERRPRVAYLAAAATATGLLLFSLYCAIDFGNAIAFINAQKGWRPSLGFDGQGWWNMLLEIALGKSDGQHSWIQRLLHPLFFSIIVSSVYLLWREQQKLSSVIKIYGFYAVVTISLILASDRYINNVLNAVMVLGGAYLLWRLRKELTSVTVLYGFCGIALLLASGGTISLSRLAYGIVPLSIALGVFLQRYPRQGYLIIGWFSVLLARIAIGFAQNRWVG